MAPGAFEELACKRRARPGSRMALEQVLRRPVLPTATGSAIWAMVRPAADKGKLETPSPNSAQ